MIDGQLQKHIEYEITFKGDFEQEEIDALTECQIEDLKLERAGIIL